MRLLQDSYRLLAGRHRQYQVQNTRTEKAVLRQLKDCFTNHINKLRFLEQQNKILMVDEPLKSQGKVCLGDL